MRKPAEFIQSSASAQVQVFRLTSDADETATLTGANQILGLRIGDTGILEHKLVNGRMRYAFTKTGSNPNVESHCPKCHVPLRKGQSLVHRGIAMTEEPIIPAAPHTCETSAAELSECVKCPRCGYSEQ